MVQTRGSTNDGPGNPPDQISTQLAAIVAKLESMGSWKEDIETLKLQAARREKNHGGGMRFDDGEPGYSNSNRRPYHKIDFPTFSGGDPRGWVVKAEKYFRFYDTSDDDKVDVAAMHLEGDALDLYSWVSAEQEITYWEELVSTLQKHFGPPEFQNPDEYLCSIKQTGSVKEYRQEFARRSSRVSQWPDHCLLGVFLNGLKGELKSDVRILKPRSVYKAVSLALEYESKLNHSKTDRRSTWSSQVKSESKPTITTTVPATTQSKPPIRISETEKQTRFLKGECFRCGDKYGPGHRCKAGTLKLLEAEEDPDDQGDEDMNSEENQGDAAEISLHAIFGRSHPTTIKVHGKLNSTEVLILVDGGSTHNFISDVLVNELKMATQPVAPFGVQIGNGDVIRCGQICKNLSVQVNDLQIVQDFYPFSIGGAELVLRIQWLATLNTVQANWKELFMVFTIDGKRYKLQGISSGPQKSSSFQHLAIENLIPKSQFLHHYSL
ncbi:putative retrotransposon gag domain, aspartic peptidase domain superfamily [Helianthus annuus]|nr:putative retrotransposon gag domain, aspartic peptidase domain superfamily [Helianthus annuus]KAJ0517053.1 putative retrotransposon gag domain, aspartic peptidase domain superfamily [Helianthus annuus]KAJ0685062.1 putative retrotransposon gag domain, aspartic peptidase domain superfamily [Helianthus annuus]